MRISLACVDTGGRRYQCANIWSALAATGSWKLVVKVFQNIIKNYEELFFGT